jgi:hypothetical protein
MRVVILCAPSAGRLASFLCVLLARRDDESRTHMRQQHFTVILVALVVVAVLAITGAAPASATSQQSASASAQAAPSTRLLTKIVLPDTSIDGPALSSVYVPNGTSESVLAWTGTDASHHLNVETSGDGLHFSGKRILPETSPYRPDVALAAPAGAVAVAWTGTDANHSLNLMPIEVTSSGLTPGKKSILSQFSSNAGPHMARVGATTFALSWTSRASKLFLATGTDVPTLSVSSLPELSAFAPQTESLGRVYGSGKQWIGWTGTDVAHHLNLQWNFTDPATKTILNEMALGGPALAIHAQEQLAWTGTDKAHHLNIATFAAS